MSTDLTVGNINGADLKKVPVDSPITEIIRDCNHGTKISLEEIKRPDAEKMLIKKAVNVAIVRRSSQQQKSFVISHVHKPGEIKHVIVYVCEVVAGKKSDVGKTVYWIDRAKYYFYDLDSLMNNYRLTLFVAPVVTEQSKAAEEDDDDPIWETFIPDPKAKAKYQAEKDEEDGVDSKPISTDYVIEESAILTQELIDLNTIDVSDIISNY